VLSYYEDPSKIYYPSGQIDLRYGISATIGPEAKDKPKEDSPYINLVTSKREYSFKADNPQSAREWTKHLQKVIFRTHNDGDSVKILLPINNIIDIEEAQFLDVADTVKIRVIDNDETYAIDEVSRLSSVLYCWS
jgi:sterol 3beta-glucosyltransferase